MQNSALLNRIYPVGSIYMSVNNVSPASFIGGTWSALQNRFLIGAGGTYTVNATGGEATHKLTANEMPAHGHGTTFGFYGQSGSGDYRYCFDLFANTNRSDKVVNSASAGGGAAHNNMPPYLAVYMWKRTA